VRISGTRLAEDVKQRMIAEPNAMPRGQDARREAEKLNAADSICYQAERPWPISRQAHDELKIASSGAPRNP